MRKLNLIVVFNEKLDETLFCIRAKEPYKGLYNFVGGKVEEGETDDEAAYRELFEETGISNKDIELDHFMDLYYYKYENNLQVYYGILKNKGIPGSLWKTGNHGPVLKGSWLYLKTTGEYNRQAL